MANFAKIGVNNVVLAVAKVDNYDTMDENGVEQESVGVAFLTRMTGHEAWLRCSFNTRGGVHYDDQGIPDNKPPFRKNFPSPGWKYDESRDAFIPPKEGHPSKFVLCEETCLYVAPVPPPEVEDKNMLAWDDDSGQWILKVQEGYFDSGAPKYILPS